MVKKDKSAIIFSALSGMSIMMGVLFLLNNNPLGLLYILIGLGLFVYVWKG